MSLIVSLIVPIFGLIAVGYGVARAGLLPAGAPDGVSAFVFVVAMPTLLFRTVATAHMGAINPVWLWLCYFAGVVVAFALGILAARRMGGADRRAGVIAGVAASFSNMVFVGIPTVSLAFGQEGLDVLALILAIHLPVMMMASTLLVERAAALDARDGLGTAPSLSVAATMRRVLRNLLKSPLIVGIFAGLAFRVTGLPLAGPVAEIVNLLAGAAGPMALVALGMSMTKFGVRGDTHVAGVITFISLLLQPAIVFVVGSFILPPLWLAVAVIGAACPAGVNAWLFATYFKSGEKLSATVIVTTTVASAVSLSFWLMLVD